jgi:hypothetical protein
VTLRVEKGSEGGRFVGGVQHQRGQGLPVIQRSVNPAVSDAV